MPTDNERLLFIDALRGIALLGILIMNVRGFGMISEAYINPMALGALSEPDKAAWIFGRLFADGKFLSIFSILFGVGIALQSSRLDASETHSATGIHFKRVFWLALFGIAHGTLIWHGDILTSYVICSLFVYWLRRLEALPLFLMAAVLLLPPLLLSHQEHLWVADLSPAEMHDFAAEYWQPSSVKIAQETAVFQGGWLSQLSERTGEYQLYLTYEFLNITFWKSSALMLIGMGLYRLNFFHNDNTSRNEIGLAVIGLVVGFSLAIYGLASDFENNWSLSNSLYSGRSYLYISSIFTALGFIALLKIIWLKIKAVNLLSIFIPVGKMAFSNYIFQSLLCTYIFYGHGFGLYGTKSYAELMVFLVPIWLVQIILSHLCLRYFYFGPLEWLWRSLTYQEIQPFRRIK